MLFALNREAGTTLIIVTHDPALASRTARRIPLSGGRLVSAIEPKSDQELSASVPLG